MSINKIKEKIKKNIDIKRNEIIKLGEKIYANPETGYKEYETSELVLQKLSELGFECKQPEDIPGVKATLDTGNEGPAVAILAELDSIVCSEHPDSDPQTGAVHACGHNIQVADMIGAAIGILNSGIADSLAGKIHFIAVPAEEYIEIEYRQQLKEKGIIKYFGGKPELLKRGFFDDVDIGILLHAFTRDKKLGLGQTSNGCLVKKIRYLGKAAHAGGAPHEGINALYAANVGITGINAIRETFKEEDYIRVHPIITKGGEVVNVIPDEVRIETYVRGKSMEAILETNKKVDRAFKGGAIALGARVEIEDFAGYYPLYQDENLNSLAEQVMEELVDRNEIHVPEPGDHSTGSTDMGDLSSLMPVIHPNIGGIEGTGHSSDFKIVDPEVSYITGSKFLACTAAELLYNQAQPAKKIIDDYQPIFSSKEEYIEFTEDLFSKKLLQDDNR